MATFIFKSSTKIVKNFEKFYNEFLKFEINTECFYINVLLASSGICTYVQKKTDRKINLLQYLILTCLILTSKRLEIIIVKFYSFCIRPPICTLFFYSILY